MNTRKNKRKSNSRHRRRRHPINMTKKMKGGAKMARMLSKVMGCYTAVGDVFQPANCMTVASVIEQAMDIPKSIQKLKKYAEIASLLLHFYQRIILPTFNAESNINYYPYLKLKIHFLDCIEDLRKSIKTLKDLNIIEELQSLVSNQTPQSSTLFNFIQGIVSNIRGRQISEAMNKTSIAIWADSYRSEIKDKIEELAALLTEFNMIFGLLHLRDKNYDPDSDDAKEEIAAAVARAVADLAALRSHDTAPVNTMAMVPDHTKDV